MVAKARTVQPVRTFGKPKPKTGGDGTFTFQLPEKLGSGRGRIAKGKYVGKCVAIESDTSEAGNPMWIWGFVTTAGPTAGRDWKMWTVLTDDAAWKVVETLRALGIECSEGEEIKINKKDVIGVGCTLHIKDDSGKDKDQFDDDGLPAFSKLDKISAHPKGAGHRSGKLGTGKPAKEVDEEDDRDYPAELDEEAPEEETEETPEEGTEELAEEEEPPRRAVAKKTAAKKVAARRR